MPPVRIVFFDAGGTLLDPWPSAGAIYAEVAAGFGLDLDPAATQHAFVRAFSQSRERAVAARGRVFGPDPAETRAFWRETLALLLDHLKQRPAAFDPLFDRLFEEFSHARRYRLIDGALDTLDALHRRGVRTGLISNWDHRLRPVLAGLGLSGRLDPVIISCEAGTEKPDPAIFRLALGRAGVHPGEALMVGDSPEADVDGALAAGMHALLLDGENWYRGPHARIEALTQTLDWLDER